MVNFVCIVFELGYKMLTLSSMENLIEACNLKFVYSRCRLSTLVTWAKVFIG